MEAIAPISIGINIFFIRTDLVKLTTFFVTGQESSLKDIKKRENLFSLSKISSLNKSLFKNVDVAVKFMLTIVQHVLRIGFPNICSS